MAKSVWKFPVSLGGFSTRMPVGSEVLTVQVQELVGPCMWALVDPEAEEEVRVFVVVGTGHPMADEISAFDYIDTFQIHGGQLVWHLFERPTESKEE